MRKEDLTTRVLDYIKYNTVVNDSGCWLFTGTKAGKGYGAVSVNGTMQYTHRVYFFAHTGMWPGRLQVCHTCDTPNCVNPSHLFLGTNVDNVRDRVNKNRCSRGKKELSATCGKGHMFTPENTYWEMPRGVRHCIECRRESQRNRKARGDI